MSSDQFSPILFSTDDLDERERVPQWREVAGRLLMKMDMAPVGDEPFHCQAIIHPLPELTVASLETSPNKLTRTGQLIADGNDDLILAIPTRGGLTTSSYGQEITLRPGEATLMSSAEASASLVQSPSRFVSIALPFAKLAPLIPDLDTALLSVVSSSVDALQLLVTYTGLLDGNLDLSLPELRRSISTHIFDLVVLALGATGDHAEVARERGMKVARMHAIKRDILRMLASGKLTMEMIASRHGISPRYLGKLFERDGTSFSEFVMERRLLRSARMLTDQRYEHVTISGIAHENGFGDVSHFNRMFRRRFGATPSGFRLEHRMASERSPLWIPRGVLKN